MTPLPSTPEFARQERLLRILSGDDTRLAARLARAGLTALTPLYGAIIGMYRGMYDTGLLEEVRLPCPVMSVGNLTVGGTGKTGLALTVARLLQANGWAPALLNYGYRATVGSGATVVSDGETVLLSPDEAGDEAALLAESLPGVPVLIGKRRVESGRMAVETFQPDVLLLDDAAQYWRLHRDVNLALLDARNPWGYGALLPRGLLRELPSALSRATAVMLTHTTRVSARRLDALRNEVARLAPRRPVFLGDYHAVGLRPLSGGLAQETPSLQGCRVGAVSALGAPEGFEATLRDLGAAEVTPYRFPDHHPYRPEEWAAVQADAASRRLDALVTTAKDAVKLVRLPLQGRVKAEGGVPALALDVEMRVTPEVEFRDYLMSSLEAARGKT